MGGTLAVMQNGMDEYIFDSCLPNEICVDAYKTIMTPRGPTDAANCISTDQYRKIAATLNGATGRIQVPEKEASGSQILVADAVLTGPTTDTSAQADSIQMSALRQVSAINQIPQYGQLLDGVWNCTDCFNIGPVALPAATDALAASVNLAAGVAGTLYLTTFLS
ncbi:hypothetical protein MMC12_001321 [Toensbergia leucococca]|nr:hypothetical protein [Toensbergia leucococca]